VKAWRAWCDPERRPADIPSNPNKVYAEWVSWSDWLGKARSRRNASVPVPLHSGELALIRVLFSSGGSSNKRRSTKRSRR
jgi:hypothetical protein